MHVRQSKRERLSVGIWWSKVQGWHSKDLKICGAKVAALCHRKYGLLLGSGTTALTLACMMLPPKRKKVIVPAIACVNVLYSILYAECIPLFVDINPESGLIDVDLILVALKQDPEIGAILVVHTFGHTADFLKIADRARELGLLIIEDAAQAFGAVYADGKPVGAYGDLALVSFGHTKILDTGGGGVLMTDSISIYENCLSIAENLPSTRDDIERCFAEYRSIYYSEWNSQFADPSALKRIPLLGQRFKETFVHKANNVTARLILKALPTLRNNLAVRRELAQIYAARLVDLNVVRLCTIEPGSVPWRFIFRVPAHNRDGLVEHLRRANVDVSCWYPSLAYFYEDDQLHQPLPNAENFTREVVNLWVNPSYSRKNVNAACDLIWNYFGSNVNLVPVN